MTEFSAVPVFEPQERQGLAFWAMAPHLLAKATGILGVMILILIGGKIWKENLLFCGIEMIKAGAGFDEIRQL